MFLSVVLQECAKRIAKVSADAKLEVDEETYLGQFKPHLMDVVYAWANGATFAQICKMTDVFEGATLILTSTNKTGSYNTGVIQAVLDPLNQSKSTFNRFSVGDYGAQVLVLDHLN